MDPSRDLVNGIARTTKLTPACASTMAPSKKKASHGYYNLSSGESEYQRLKAIRDTRVARIMQVREQEKKRSKLRSEAFENVIQAGEAALLEIEEWAWDQARDDTLGYMQAMYEHLKENVGAGHRRADAVVAKAAVDARAEARLDAMREADLQERFASALRQVNEERRAHNAAATEFKERRDHVMETELARAQRRIAEYVQRKKQREAEQRETRQELLRMLAPSTAPNYKRSHLHELGVPQLVRRHKSSRADAGKKAGLAGEGGEGEDATQAAAAFNRMLVQKEDERKRRDAERAFRTSERVHAAAEVVRGRRDGAAMGRELQRLWLKDRKEKIDAMLARQKERVQKARAAPGPRSLEREAEAILGIPSEAADGAASASAAGREGKYGELRWGRSLPREAPKRTQEAQRGASGADGGDGESGEGATEGGMEERREGQPRGTKAGRVDIAIPRAVRPSRGGAPKPKPKPRHPTVAHKATATQASQPLTSTAAGGGADPSHPRPRKKAKGKRKEKGKGRGGSKAGLSAEGLATVESYLNARDPLNLKKLEEDISALTSSVLTDGTALARAERAHPMGGPATTETETTTTTTGDGGSTLGSISQFLERRGYGSLPSVPGSDTTSSDLLLELGPSAPLGSGMPEVRSLSDLMKDSFFGSSSVDTGAGSGGAGSASGTRTATTTTTTTATRFGTTSSSSAGKALVGGGSEGRLHSPTASSSTTSSVKDGEAANGTAVSFRDSSDDDDDDGSAAGTLIDEFLDRMSAGAYSARDA